MGHIKLYLLLFTLTVLCFGCISKGNQNELNQDSDDSEQSPIEVKAIENILLLPTDYINWVENYENGLVSEKILESYKFTLLYKPYEYLVLKENDSISNDIIKQKIDEIKGLQYFTLRIALKEGNGDLIKNNAGSPNEINNRIEYFSFKIQNDLCLLEGKDTLKCVLSHFERTFGLTPYCDIIMAFDTSINNQNDKILLYNDKIFGLGPIKLKINKQSINNVKKLKLQI